MTLAPELLAKRTAVIGLASDHGAGSVRVFGSTVRGDFRADSDIDFLVAMASDACCSIMWHSNKTWRACSAGRSMS